MTALENNPDEICPYALTAKNVVAPVESSNLAATNSFDNSPKFTSSVRTKLPPLALVKVEPFCTMGT